MGMSEMRGPLADAVRDSHVLDVRAILAKYEKETYSPFMMKRVIKRLKDAERLARSMQKRNAEIQKDLKVAREALLARPVSRAAPISK